MTQPNEFFPEDASNFDSFAAFAAKGQSSYEDERRSAEEDRWGLGGILGGLFPEGIRSGIAFPLALVEAVVKRILAPFGGGTDNFTDLTSALNLLTQTLALPFQMLTNITEWIEDLFTQHDSEIAGLRAQINALRVELVPTIDGTGAYDDCKTVDNFTNVTGTLAATGWGAVTSSATAVAHYDTSPTTNRHGAGIKVKNRKTGITRVHICSDDAMTNFVCLELENPLSGADVVRVRTGSGPTTLTTQKEQRTNVASDTFWEIFYEPYDEASATSNTFHVFAGGKEIQALRWQDNGNIVTHPEDPVATPNRVGITVNGLNHSSRRGWDVTDFTWYDWQAAAPA